MPFGDYADMDDCISKNSDKEDPAAYCASIQKQAEKTSKKTVEMNGKKYIVVAENVPINITATIKQSGVNDAKKN